MTNSAVLQYIIEELEKTKIVWGNDRELFEMICEPLPYGNDVYQKRKEIKELILAKYAGQIPDKSKFNALADNIICGNNEKAYRAELLRFMGEETMDSELGELIEQLPCKCENEKNYKNNFNNWKNGKTDRINRREVRERLEKNFYFAPSLWDMGEATVKQAIREGVGKFVNNQFKKPAQIFNLFETVRSEFSMHQDMTEKEKRDLESIQYMSETEIMEYVALHYPLSTCCTQAFIQALVPIFYQKGYYDLLLHDVLESLEVHLQNSTEIKKIKAHIYGSPIVGEYMKAFNILSTIESDNDAEIIDLRTEAISNIRRHYLSDKTIDLKQKQEYVDLMITYYEDIFKHNDTFHYYPGINLIYLKVIEILLSESETKKRTLNQTIKDIYDKALPSIIEEKKSTDLTKRYYAHMAELEYILLKGVGNPLAELERFLELENTNIPLEELTRTQRQMQFFVDAVNVQNKYDDPIVQRVQNAIDIIDDFMESYIY